MSEAENLLRYLWLRADIEVAVATHDRGSVRAMRPKVRDLFGPNDPLTIDIERVLADSACPNCQEFGAHCLCDTLPTP